MGIIQKSVAEELERQAATAVKRVEGKKAEQESSPKQEEATVEEPNTETTEEAPEEAPVEEKKKTVRPRKSRK